MWHEGRIVRWLGSSRVEGFSVLQWYYKEENWYLLVCFGLVALKRQRLGFYSPL